MGLDEPWPADVIIMNFGNQYLVWTPYTDCEPVALDDEVTARLVAKVIDAAFMAGIGQA